MLGQVLACGAVLLDGACRRDVVRRDRIAEHSEDACVLMSSTGAGVAVMPSKYGALRDVGRVASHP